MKKLLVFLITVCLFFSCAPSAESVIQLGSFSLKSTATSKKVYRRGPSRSRGARAQKKTYYHSIFQGDRSNMFSKKFQKITQKVGKRRGRMSSSARLSRGY